VTDYGIAADVVAAHEDWARADITLVKRTVTARDEVFDDATVNEAETPISGIWTPRKRDLVATKGGGVLDEYDELRVLPAVELEAGDHVKVDGVEARVEAVVPAYRRGEVVEKVARCTRVGEEAEA
jgi:hypothetical protein